MIQEGSEKRRIATERFGEGASQDRLEADVVLRDVLFNNETPGRG